MTDMGFYIGGVKLPRPAVSGFKKIEKMNGTTVTTLGNSIYTDFTNISRSWQITYSDILYADYDTIRTLYFRQNLNGYLYLSFPSYGIYTPVLMEISEANLGLNGTIVSGFSFTLREQSSVS